MSPVSDTPVLVLMTDPPPAEIMCGTTCLIISIVPRALIWNARSHTAASSSVIAWSAPICSSRVSAALAADRRGYHLADAVLLGEIEALRESRAAFSRDIGSHRFCTGYIDVREHYRSAGTSQRPCASLADIGAGAGDDRHPAR